MIITCPQCDARFVVPSTVFMRGGRKMKCASCTHIWFQDEPLEKSDAVKNFVRDMDKGTKKKSSNGNSNVFLNTMKHEIIDGKFFIITGFSCVLIIFFIIQFLASAPVIMGQGLAFDNITFKRDHDALVVEGKIINTMNDDRGLPQLQITELLSNDILGNTHLRSLNHDVLHSNQTVPFVISLDDIGAEVKYLTISFEGNKNNHETLKKEEPHASSNQHEIHKPEKTTHH